MPYKDPGQRRKAGRERMRRWRAADPVRALEAYRLAWDRNPWRQRLLTEEEFTIRFAMQEGRCANPGCQSFGPGSTKGWHIDHDHQTGKVRGILCHPCNVHLGRFKEDRAILQAHRIPRIRGLSAYLETPR